MVQKSCKPVEQFIPYLQGFYTDFIHPKGKEVDLVPQKPNPFGTPKYPTRSKQVEAETL